MVKLLIVDDEKEMRYFLATFFQERGYLVSTAADGNEALERMKDFNPHLVFLDISMPGMSGLGALPLIKQQYPLTKVIMVTAYDDPQLIAQAKDLGAVDYVHKPFSFDYLQNTVLNKVYANLFEELRNEHATLEKTYVELKDSTLQTITSLAKALEYRDEYTRGHSQRTTYYALKIAEELNLPYQEMEILSQAGLLHDIGKIGLMDDVLKKPAALAEHELQAVKQHPLHSGDIVGLISALKAHAKVIRHHHERWDGTGYPDGLKGDQIPLLSCILAVADTYDAMTSTRPYRKALPPEVAYQEINKNSGTQFNPQVVEAFNRAFAKGKLNPQRPISDIPLTL